MNKRRNNNNTIALNLPIYHFASQVMDFVSRIEGKANDSDVAKMIKNPFKNFKFGKNLKKVITQPMKYWMVFLLIAVVALVAFGLTKNPIIKSSTSQVAQTSTDATAVVEINKQFNFPIRGEDGKETGTNLPVKVVRIERAKRIILNGSPLSARDTKDFMLVYFEIENKTKNELTVRPVDFIRLISVDNKNFAPELYNTPTKVEPDSVKRTRVGFIVDESQKEFKFLIGEITGNRETIEVKI